MRVTLESIYDGAQKSWSGINSAPVLKTHGAAQAESWLRHPSQLAAGMFETLPSYPGVGWQKASEKSGFFIAGNSFHLQLAGGHEDADL
jgi:hypothetical protein